MKEKKWRKEKQNNVKHNKGLWMVWKNKWKLGIGWEKWEKRVMGNEKKDSVSK